MKATHVTFGALLGCTLITMTAMGQTLKQPLSVRPAGLSYDYSDSDDQEDASPSDKAVSPAVPVIDTSAGCGQCAERDCTSCDRCGGTGGCNCYLFGDGQAFKLVDDNNCLGLKAGFWSQIGYHTQGANRFGTGLMNSYPNRVQLQQQWAYLEKEVDTGGCGFDWGFRMDYVYGTDGPDTQAFFGRPTDWDNDWDNGGAYGHAIPQLYAAVGYNNLTVKMGHWYTIQGYEVVPATGNFFYSHAYTFYLGEPFTHSGVLAEYAWTDDITFFGGWSVGWDTGFSSNGGNNFIGGFALQLTENLNFTYTTTMGDFGVEPYPNSDTNGYSHTLLLTYKFGDRWTYVAQSDVIDNDSFLQNVQNLSSFAQYLRYDYNDCLAFGARLEWFKDPRIGLSASGEVTALTLGMNYKPHANVVLRPEVRWDDFDPNSRGGFRDSTELGIDAIITY